MVDLFHYLIITDNSVLSLPFIVIERFGRKGVSRNTIFKVKQCRFYLDTWSDNSKLFA